MIEFLKTKGVAILGAFLVMFVFLMSNVATVFALNNNLTLVDDQTATVPCSTDTYRLLYGGSNLKPSLLMTTYADKTITIVNKGTQNFELCGYISDSGNTSRILLIEAGSEYVLDSAFWENISQTNSDFESMQNRAMYLTCSGNVSGDGLEVTLSKGLSSFEKVLKFVVAIGESLFSLAGTTVTFIVNHPIALFGLLVGLIYTGILIFRLITKGV